MSISSPPVTAEQLWAAPNDGLRRELVRGEIVTMNPSGAEHGDVVMQLSWRLAQHVQQQQLGVVFGAETGFVLARNPDTVRAPDIAFVRQSRIEGAGVPASFFNGPPDLAVEVISPSDRPSEVEAKIDDWLQHGTISVWVIDPRRRTVGIHCVGETPRMLGDEDWLEEPELLPGFRIKVGEFLIQRQ